MLKGSAGEKPRFLSGRGAVVWSRHYSAAAADRCDCGQLAEVLGRVPGAQRMVVGHTIQEGGINSACQGRVLRIDVGLSRGCGNGSPEVSRGWGTGVCCQASTGSLAWQQTDSRWAWQQARSDLVLGPSCRADA